jgi:CBS domain containing-hemolysin-like protein
MSWSWYAIGAAMALAAACSFFFALAESALFALGKWRAQQLARDRPAEARRLSLLFDEPQNLLATLALGNTLANGMIIGLTVWIFRQTSLGGSYLSQLCFGLGVFGFVLIACEALPKTLGVRSPEFWSIQIAPSLSLSMALARPLRRVAQVIDESFLKFLLPKVPRQPSISDEEYQELLAIAQQQGALLRSEKEMILQILHLDQRNARDVMKSRSQISCIPDDLSKEEMIETARKIKHTRIPLFDETPDTIVGVLNARALLLNPGADIEEVIEFPSFVPETMNLLHLLRSLQRQQRGLAIVLDEFGGTAGLVTMEDILEEMLGTFQKRDEQTFLFEKLAPGKWRVNGTCPLDEFRREYPALPQIEEVDTMGGLLVRQLEYVPAEGESVVHAGLRLTAQKADDRRVMEVLAEAQRK